MSRIYTADNLTELPAGSGVYYFRDAAGVVLYVGKATSLRARVRQYFSGQEERSRGARMRRLVAETATVVVQETPSALEALILEANEIRRYQPRYNVEQKDDKSFSYFLITRETFPRIVIVRGSDIATLSAKGPAMARGELFGPYTSRTQMLTALRILRKIFPFHSRAEDSEARCLDYQIGLCPGPYDGAIDAAAYKRNICGIRMMLAGKRTRLVASLTRAMERAAREERFEDAARARDQVTALTHIRDVALMTDGFDGQRTGATIGRVECFDMSHLQGSGAVGGMVVFERGMPERNAFRRFRVKHADPDNDLATMREVLARRVMHTDWPVPDAIVLDGGAVHLAMAEELWKALGVTIPLLAVAKGPTRRKVDVFPSRRYTPSAVLTGDRVLLEALREAAHDYAIRYHRHRRDTELLTGQV